MPENYFFILQWSELPKKLREKKIDRVITLGLETGKYDKRIGDKSLPDNEEDLLEELHLRDEVEEEIKTHFPICR